MAIKIGNLNLKKPETGHIYTDFNHRFLPNKTYNENSIPVKNDILVSYDLNAIKNEIQNLLNSPKYSRILNPEFGFDFLRWIGQPVSQGFADMQRMTIVNILQSGSGRFKVDNLQIIAVPEEKLYLVTLQLSSPYFTGNQEINGFVDGTGSITLL